MKMGTRYVYSPCDLKFTVITAVFRKIWMSWMNEFYASIFILYNDFQADFHRKIKFFWMCEVHKSSFKKYTYILVMYISLIRLGTINFLWMYISIVQCKSVHSKLCLNQIIFIEHHLDVNTSDLSFLASTHLHYSDYFLRIWTSKRLTIQTVWELDWAYLLYTTCAWRTTCVIMAKAVRVLDAG